MQHTLLCQELPLLCTPVCRTCNTFSWAQHCHCFCLICPLPCAPLRITMCPFARYHVPLCPSPCAPLPITMCPFSATLAATHVSIVNSIKGFTAAYVLLKQTCKSQLQQGSRRLWCRNRQLGLIFLKEVKRGTESRFHGWIESLPKEVPTLIHWTDKELQQLQLDSTTAEKDLLAEVCLRCALPHESESLQSDLESCANHPVYCAV